MGLKTELKRFSSEHPLLSIMYIGFIGFTAIDLAASTTLPRGKGPFSGLGATTSTSTTTSSSHPPIVRESMQQHAAGPLSGFHGAGMGHCNCASPSCPSCKKGLGFHHGVGESDSRQLPPGLRRRMMARTYESSVEGSHIGKQDISVRDRSNNNAMKNVSGMYGLSGVLPETGGGWTE